MRRFRSNLATTVRTGSRLGKIPQPNRATCAPHLGVPAVFDFRAGASNTFCVTRSSVNCCTPREKGMKVTPVVVEQCCDKLPEQEIVELSTSELGEIGGGMADPGVIEIEK